jgi:hypothetical protein
MNKENETEIKQKDNEEIIENTFEFQNSKLYKKLIELFDEHLLTDIQKLAAFKFIKEKFLDKENHEADRLKQWILLRVNGKFHPKNIDLNQKGCTDIVPGLTIRGWWNPADFPWIKSITEKLDIIKEELINLRENLGFQPYKSQKYVSDITVNLI